MRNRFRGRPRPFLGVGTLSAQGGVIIADPAGYPQVLPFDDLFTAIGAGDVTGPGSSTDNGIARFDGTTGKLLQDTSGPKMPDDGRISNVTDPTSDQDAATKKYVDDQISGVSSGSGGGGGHLHGLMRVLGDGATTTFDLLDFAEYLEHVAVNGSVQDPATFTLSTDRSQITFDSAPVAGNVIALEYVIAGI